MTVAPAPILLVTGLAREARVAGGVGIETIGAGGDPPRLRLMLAGEGAVYRAVISFGVAGGLDPGLAPGAVIVASGIVSGEKGWPADTEISRRWAKRLAETGERVLTGTLAGAETAILDIAGKQSLRAKTGAAAVDMESHVAAAFAAAHRLPFGAIRVVCDPAGRALPPLAAEALRPNGGLDLPAILRSLVRRPTQLVTLPGLARDAAKAVAALGRVRASLGPGFGLGGLRLDEPFGDVL